MVAILQCNIHGHGSLGIERVLSNQEFDVLLLQEVTKSQQLVLEAATKRWSFFHSDNIIVTKSNQHERRLAIVAVREGYTARAVWTSSHCVAVEVEDKGIFATFYNQAPQLSSDGRNCVTQLRNMIKHFKQKLDPSLAIFVAGDTNAHHPSWATATRRGRFQTDGVAIAGMFEEAQMTLLTPVDLGTFVSTIAKTAKQKCTTIDIAWSRGLRLRAHPEADLSITRSIKGKVKSNQHIPLCYFTTDGATTKKQTQAGNEGWKMPNEIDTNGLCVAFRKHAQEKGIERLDKVEELWEALENSIQKSAIEAQIGRQNNTQKRIPNWDAEGRQLKKARKEAIQSAQAKIRSSTDKNVPQTQLQRETRQEEAVKASRNAMRAYERKKERELYAEMLRDDDPYKRRFYRLVAHTRTKGERPSQDIRYLVSKAGMVVQGSEEIAKELMFTLQPGLTREEGASEVPPKKGNVEEQEWEEPTLTEQEIRSAIENDTNKAPGHDGIKASLIQTLAQHADQFMSTFGKLTRLCFGGRPIPDKWRLATIVTIPKPNRAPDLASSHRPITLLSVPSKIYERMVAARLQFTSLVGGLCLNQFGALAGRSAEDAITRMNQFVFEQRSAKRALYLVGADVVGAYNNARHKELEKALKEVQNDGEPDSGKCDRTFAACLDWLRGRRARVRVNGVLSAIWKSHEKRMGIPQGSPLSPALWLAYLNPLAKRLEAHFKDDVLVTIYVDDINVIVSGATWQEARDKAIKVKEMIQDWARNEGKVNLDKAITMAIFPSFHATSAEEKIKEQRIAKEEGKKIGLCSDAQGYTSDEIHYSCQVLGVTLTEDWSMVATMERKQGKVMATIRSLRPLRHLPTCFKIMIAKLILCPILDWGIWPFLPLSPAALNRARAADTRILCFVLNLSYKHVSEGKMYLSVCKFMAWLPVEARAYIRLRKTGVSRNGNVLTESTNPELSENGLGYFRVKQRAGQVDLMNENVLNHIRPVPVHPAQWASPFGSLTIKRTRIEAHTTHKEIRESATDKIFIYTDGSSLQRDSGNSVAGYGARIERGDTMIHLSKPNNHPLFKQVVHSELYAIKAALETVASASELAREGDGEGLPDVYIFSDSQTALYKIYKERRWNYDQPEDQVREVANNAQARLAKEAKIHLVWIPAHEGIEGNESADMMAKEGASRGVEHDRHLLAIIPEAKRWAWSYLYDGAHESRTAKELEIEFNREAASILADLDLQIPARHARLMYLYLTGHRFQRGPNSLNACELCGRQLYSGGSPEAHLILKCRIFGEERTRLLIEKDEQDTDTNWLRRKEHLGEFLEIIETELIKHRSDETAEDDDENDANDAENEEQEALEDNTIEEILAQASGALNVEDMAVEADIDNNPSLNDEEEIAMHEAAQMY